MHLFFLFFPTCILARVDPNPLQNSWPEHLDTSPPFLSQTGTSLLSNNSFPFPSLQKPPGFLLFTRLLFFDTIL